MPDMRRAGAAMGFVRAGQKAAAATRRCLAPLPPCGRGGGGRARGADAGEPGKPARCEPTRFDHGGRRARGADARRAAGVHGTANRLRRPLRAWRRAANGPPTRGAARPCPRRDLGGRCRRRSRAPRRMRPPGKVYYRRGDLGARDMMRGLDGRGRPPPELHRPARSGPAPAPGCVARWRAAAGRMRRAPASIKRAGCLAARIDGCPAARNPSPGRRGGRWGAARIGKSPANSAPPGAPGGRRRQKRGCGGEAFPPLPAAGAPATKTPDARRGRRRGAGWIAAARPGGLDD